MMNVNYPKDDITFINTTFIVCLIGATMILGYGAWRYGMDAFKKLGIIATVFIIGVSASISPWLIKNISEVGISNLSIGTLLSGK